MKVIYDGIDKNLPIKMWADDIEEGALKQAKNLCQLPFAFKHVAIMPDCHQGYGMPIGGVLATKDYIIPNAVGVDIGCGMRAVKTHIDWLSENNIKNILQRIRETIPVGFKHNNKANYEAMPDLDYASLPIVDEQYESAAKQIGTLGGGNHFIELQQDANGFYWFMIHSGSRNLGYKVAKFYNDAAKKLNELWQSVVPKKWELAFLPAYTEIGQRYLEEMYYCIKFANENRWLMMCEIKEAIEAELGNIKYDLPIDISHNYVRQENHFGQNVWVHRKGATYAGKDVIGIIPGSQGTKSYIVKGLGNPESFESCSHGAGRKMSRTEARKTLNLADEKALLDEQGIIHAIRNESDLDESPSAYKDIETVMENQKDLVEIVEELTPLAVIKG